MALKPIKLDNKTRKELSKKLDSNLIKTRTQYGGGGKSSLSYISANTCIDLLNKAFGHNWSMRIVDRWMEQGVQHPFVEKDGKKPVAQGPTAWCIVELSVDFMDENGNVRTITKSAFGSQSITGNQSVQSTNGYKGAQSDALKKAATLFGVALELYRDPSEESYFKSVNEDLFVIWSDELKAEYVTEFNYLNTICELNGYTLDDLAYWIVQVTDGKANNIDNMEPEYMSKLIKILEDDADLEHPINKGAK